MILVLNVREVPVEAAPFTILLSPKKRSSPILCKFCGPTQIFCLETCIFSNSHFRSFRNVRVVTKKNTHGIILVKRVILSLHRVATESQKRWRCVLEFLGWSWFIVHLVDFPFFLDAVVYGLVFGSTHTFFASSFIGIDTFLEITNVLLQNHKTKYYQQKYRSI